MSFTSVNKELLLDGKPQTLLCAEFHYYRTPKHLWEERLKLVVEAGFTCVASYIPWLIHEEFEGDFDFTGRKRGEHDLVGFIELLESYGLYFIPRPGPFIMAEMKNDGVPFWVYQKYPHIKPITWDHKQGTTVTVDYMDKDFLSASKTYYEQIIPLLVNKLHPKGNVIALQLDNEVGMLSWVSNNPELNEPVIKSFIQFLNENNPDATSVYPFLNNDFKEIVNAIRTPKSDYINQLHLDLGYFFRHRLDLYLTYLKDLAEQLGFKDHLFLINIHGCSAGRTMMYPIGISQLYPSYYGKKNVISGSDVYISQFDVPQFHDAYMANILTDATNDKDQALTSLEFSAGTGDYGNNFSQRYPTSRIDFMTRAFIALGNKLLNFYTFVGGRNYRFDYALHDGNDRIASTGEAHGFAAPITPYGTKSYVYDKTKYVVQLMRTHQNFLATQKPVFDDITYGFIPDYFMTEFHYPGIDHVIHKSLQRFRTGGSWDVVVKSLLLLHYHFDATNLDMFDPDPKKLLILPSAEYMSESVQMRILSFLKQGGKLLLYGQIPRFDLKGNPCTVLADYFELSFIRDFIHQGHRFRTSIVAVNKASGRPELHRDYFQTWKTHHEEDIMFKVYHSNEACGFFLKDKNAILITTEYRSDLELFESLMNELGVKKHLNIKQNLYHGIFAFETYDDTRNTTYYHVINMDDFDKDVVLETRALGDYPLHLDGNEALMLPYNLELNEKTTLIFANNELIAFDDHHLTFKLNGPLFEMKLKTTQNVSSSDPNVSISNHDGILKFIKSNRYVHEKTLTIQLN
ncbi:MAG: hypothetical protein A2Y45_07755 [Tenericutes bacterium GWC2_34_14]|nr:MAG: hypothetical protein A2Y45_07755 [Tenericutes bacterium GWC2_34_14]OHE34773.1 MAG: hypothetical protein A2012_01365 [Tenericutes bacterium GWE2_34_108]OHE37366.1 MAG: hypothetical protein A2Y46_01645 [Tenericutes bacterium GWF1_35_14]OHE39501.1 MAG: hypothetical protein A2Y44_01215 [Tenericutes bacterium GWF2_35_184]OHE44310.1 MAG: hypothetical protein A2221_04295 [Tenericutes bacterium RIFOXYA2_FULL_36_32]OHE46893.1 MAG: hypothetical protein A3K26_03195 [Tenericutes bacterium RIFOXYA1